MPLNRLFLNCSAALGFAAAITLSAIASAESESDFSSAVAPVTAQAQCAKTRKTKIERLESLGPLTEVTEPDILEAFKSRVRAMQKSGEYDRRLKANKNRIASELEHPKAVEGLVPAQGLTITPIEAAIPEKLPQSLMRQAANVKIGRFSRPLLFIDGEDEASLKAALSVVKEQPQTRVVLVRGAPAEVSERLERRIYFDQGGALVRLFEITSVPALLFNDAEGPVRAEFASSKVHELLAFFK